LYKIKLDQFEGPLDLLLFFIKRDELNIYDIPISKITKEFLEYVNLIKMLDLEIAGDFILMASTLMHIKVRMLLPREVDEKGDEIDPRAELIQALLEYKKYKEMSEELAFFESSQRRVNFRGNYSADNKVSPPDYEILLKNVTIYDLAKAFKKALESVKTESFHEVRKLNISVDEQISFILTKLTENPKLHFLSLVVNMKDKLRIVITFVALLELTKMGMIGIEESPKFNDFVIVLVSSIGVPVGANPLEHSFPEGTRSALPEDTRGNSN
jgi:segregation and condensation protein A